MGWVGRYSSGSGLSPKATPGGEALELSACGQVIVKWGRLHEPVWGEVPGPLTGSRVPPVAAMAARSIT
jgi:hypothetical protein